MLERFRKWLPSPEALSSNRWLRWLGPGLLHPRLWHMSRRGVSTGMAVGLFWGLLIPIGQIPFAAATALVLRANVPVAAAATFITNPFTFPPVYYAAWRTGKWVLGEPVAAGADPTLPGTHDELTGRFNDAKAAWSARAVVWLKNVQQHLGGVGKALAVGLALFACTVGFGVYLLVSLAWVWKIRWARRRRLAARPQSVRTDSG